MTFNINRVNIHDINCYLTGLEARKIYNRYRDDLPEINLFDEIDLLGYNDNEVIVMENLDWCGTWSGNSYNIFCEILKNLHGDAKFSIVWEDGSIEYFKLKNGEIQNIGPNW